MVDELTMDAFRREVLNRLQAPINDYFDALDRLAQPRPGIGGLLQPFTSRIERALALSKVKQAMRYALQQSHIVAAVLGNDQQALNEQQNARVVAIIADQQGYLDGFMADLPQMSRSEALNRASMYVASVIQTVSQIVSGRLPELPILPGDERLACVRHAGGVKVCKCYLDIRQLPGPGNYDVFWIQTALESCVDCIALGKAWNPLRIRNGQIMGEPLSETQIKMLREAGLAV